MPSIDLPTLGPAQGLRVLALGCLLRNKNPESKKHVTCFSYLRNEALSCYKLERIRSLSNTMLHDSQTKSSTRLRQLLQGGELIVSSALSTKPPRVTHHTFR